MKISRETITKEMLDEACVLGQMSHCEVIYDYEEEQGLNIPLVVQMAELEMAYVYTIRKEEKIVGYILFFVAHDILYMKAKIASSESVFVHPDHRGMASIKLFRFAEKDLKSLGVKYIFHQSMLRKDLGSLYERLGYKEVSRKYIKRV